MYGSQLIAVNSHHNKDQTLGVSDSKDHDTSKVHSDFTPQPTPPTSESMMSENAMMSTSTKTSKKPKMAEKSESATSGQRKESSFKIGGENLKMVQ